jgi:hypothetical protein
MRPTSSCPVEWAALLAHHTSCSAPLVLVVGNPASQLRPACKQSRDSNNTTLWLTQQHETATPKPPERKPSTWLPPSYLSQQEDSVTDHQYKCKPFIHTSSAMQCRLHPMFLTQCNTNASMQVVVPQQAATGLGAGHLAWHRTLQRSPWAPQTWCAAALADTASRHHHLLQRPLQRLGCMPVALLVWVVLS